jgi:CRISPR-associated protein Cas1
VAKDYFSKYFNLIPKTFDIKLRKKYRAKDRFNNLLNLGYGILKTEMFKAIMPTHLDPFMGYLHSDQHTKPSLICDMQEPFRCAIDELLITYVRELDPKEDFRLDGRRWYLTSEQNKEYIMALNKMFEGKIEYNRKDFAKKCKLRTVIKEEAIKLGLYLRGEKRKYLPYTF